VWLPLSFHGLTDPLTSSHDGPASMAQNQITAIDILLEPDATIVQRAQAANAWLLKNFPKGYKLDAEHKPHISVMGGYVYAADMEKIYLAVDQVLATENVLSWKMKAFKYYYMPLKEIGLGGIGVEATTDMMRLQRKLVDTLTPFMAPGGSAAAFATTPNDPEINQLTLDVVATYMSSHTGEHYAPHVTIGVGRVDYLNALVASPFPTFTFSAVGVSIYQFGNFGTAMKLLHCFKLMH
jgi:hypothetical protein